MTFRYRNIPDDGRCPECGLIDWKTIGLQTAGYDIHVALECRECYTRVIDTEGVTQ